jgi:hypothetical protein
LESFLTPNDQPDASILDAKLAALFRQAVGGALDSLRSLRESVCMYVETERDRGTPMDVVVAKVSTMIERVRRQSVAETGVVAEPTAAERELAKEMINWCVDTYLPAKARKKI